MPDSEDCMVILHISDLHFSFGETEQDAINQHYVFKKLQNLFLNFDSAWKPDILCITGDITYQNRDEGYEQATIWIKKFLQRLSIDIKNVFICPGNHEIDRAKARESDVLDFNDIDIDKKTDSIDRVLSIPLVFEYKDLFHKYNQFCSDLQISPYKFNDRNEFVIGKREYKGVRFVCNNSCWFSYETDEIWLGRNFVKTLLPNEMSINSPITIGLTHHPKGYFSDAEQFCYLDRNPPLVYLSDRCHLILTGHAHARPGPKEIFANARWFNAGCCGQSDKYRNNFTLIRLCPQTRMMDYRRYEWDGGKDKWEKFDEELGYHLDNQQKIKMTIVEKILEKPDFKNDKSETKIQAEINNVFHRIRDHIFSLDYEKAISIFERNQDVINHKYSPKDIREEIELLIIEAQDD